MDYPVTEPEPERADPIAGELVTETFDYDVRRWARVYMLPDPPEAVVFAGDGHLISQWGAHLETADVPPTMIVGAYRTGDTDEMVRIQGYSPSFNPERFADHERFFAADLRRWVRPRFGVALPADRTAVCGVFASGEFSFAMGLGRPDIYGAVFSALPGGGYQPPGVQPSPLPRT
jgi:enterochelin esterase-like enzyme